MAGEVGGGERMPAAITDAHGGVACSCVTAVVAVKLAMASATRPYGDDGPNERKVGGAVEMAGHGRAQSSATAMRNVATPRLERLQWRVMEVEEMVVELWARWIS